MSLFRNLVFLVAASMVTAQGFFDNQKLNATAPKYSQEQVARILQAPLFRSNQGTQGNLPNYSPYAALNFDIAEPKELGDETQTTSFLSPVPVPSAILLPPRIDALDSFTPYKSQEQVKPLPTYQALPYANSENLKPFNSQSQAQVNSYKPQYLRPVPSALSYLPINPLSKQLDLPLPSVPKTNFAKPSRPASDLQVPLFEPYVPYNAKPQLPLPTYSAQSDDIYKVPSRTLETPYPTLSQTLDYTKGESLKPIKNPTKYYPKKYNSQTDEFTPKKIGKQVEIDGDDLVEITKIRKANKPQKLTYSPVLSEEVDSEYKRKLQKKQELDKQRHKFEEAQKKQQARKDEESRKQQQLVSETLARASVAGTEPVASESGFNYQHGLDGSLASPAHHSLDDEDHGAGGERTDFQIHGQHGPKSYKFGYDTGKGKNRQFRYEERDHEGYVKGHYGFYDKQGKLQVVNYDAHPHHGFHAEGSFGKP